MIGDAKIKYIIDIAWDSYINKVSSGLLNPENEKMMQLQLAQIFQTLFPLFEYHKQESIKILLEYPTLINREPPKRIIDLFIIHSEGDIINYYPIELKCFREYTRDGTGKKRGAQNIGMFDYWCDIENIEQYCCNNNFLFGTQLTLTDDRYYVTGRHLGDQTATYSTNWWRKDITGELKHPIANRCGIITLNGNYSMDKWIKKSNFYFIKQEFVGKEEYVDLPKKRPSES